MLIINKKAHFNYNILHEVDCGIVLNGSEVKTIKSGSININDAYAIIKDNEVFVLNWIIPIYKLAFNRNNNLDKNDPNRMKKLLLKLPIIRKDILGELDAIQYPY